jgi:hypothetical protein
MIQLYVVLSAEQDELWANAHLWYPRSSANKKSESDGSKTLPIFLNIIPMKLLVNFSCVNWRSKTDVC